MNIFAKMIAPGLLACLTFLASAVFATADDQDNAAIEAGIKAAITTQLQAFRRNDAKAAWAIAAPTIQKRFGTAERFMDMVGKFYPQILRSKTTVFKGLRVIDGNIIQRVFVKGGPGDYVDAYYTVELIDGVWRIAGCSIAKPKPEGA